MIMTVENDGTVVIKAPKWTRTAKADRFYRINLGWIADKRKKLKENSGKIITLTAEDINMLKKKAADVMRRKTEYYSSVMGVKPDSIKITSAYKRWGSCSLPDAPEPMPSSSCRNITWAAISFLRRTPKGKPRNPWRQP